MIDPNAARFLRISRRDKEILKTISDVLLEHIEGREPSNASADGDVYISDEDAAHLLELLQQLIEDPTFQRRARFSESVVAPNGLLRPKMARIYFANSRGLSRGSTNENIEREWQQFVDRYATMTFHEFLAQEGELLRQLDVHPAVTNLLVNLTFDFRNVVDDPGSAERIRTNSIKRAVERTIKALAKRTSHPNFRRAIREVNLSSVGIIVADSVALFTTRDLNVVGVISTLSGASLSLRK
jgi:hypothetical protein